MLSRRRVIMLVVQLLLAFVLPLSFAMKTAPVGQIEVLSFDNETQLVTFSVPCPGCLSTPRRFNGQSPADLALILAVRPQTQKDAACLDVVVQDQVVSVTRPVSGWYLGLPENVSTRATDTNGRLHAIDLQLIGYVDTPMDGDLDLLDIDQPESLSIAFNIVSIDDVAQDESTASKFRVGIEVDANGKRLSTVGLDPVYPLISLKNMTDSPEQPSHSLLSTPSALDDDLTDSDIEVEVELLQLLEADARMLDAQIVAKKQALYSRIKDRESRVPLRELLEKCDDILCKARTIAERLCQKAGIDRPSNPESWRTQSAYSQRLLSIQTSVIAKWSQTIHNGTKVDPSNITLTSSEKTPSIYTSQNSTTNTDYHLGPSGEHSIVLRALSIIASIFGLLAIYSFIRRKCMSMRKRVERAADREERRNARAYRRAARRAYIRRRWDGLVSAISCFKTTSDEPPRIEDYEEKRALILQDALLEQGIEHAEKGEIMEAEIRELRHAQEIVASLVRRSGEIGRHDFVDPPPPLVPLPFTPITRSRASSGTLPSYTSESLPDYTSSPGSDHCHHNCNRASNFDNAANISDNNRYNSAPIMNGFAHYTLTSDGQGMSTPPTSFPTQSTGSTVSYSITSRSTPVSSIIAISPRCSEETLRTRQSDRSSRLY